MMRLTHLLSMPLLLAGCVDQLHEEAHALTFIETETTSSTSGSGVPTTSQAATDPVQTVTSDTTLDASTAAVDETTASSGEPANVPPTIDLFEAEPNQLSEAGKSLLQLHASDDVITVRLFQNGEKIAELTPADFPYTYEAFSAKYNGDPHTFMVEVLDAEGLKASADLKLTVLLPPSGAERCHFTDENMGAKSSAIMGLAYTADVIVAVGLRDTGPGDRMTIWKLDKATCKLIPGWPRTLADWTAEPALAKQSSRAVGVAIDASGYIAVAANLSVGGKPQLYAALLTPQGSRVWETTGYVGEESAGIAAGDDHRVYVVGAVQTGENPLRTDARIWRLDFGNGTLLIGQSDLRAPFKPGEFDPDMKNIRSERSRAVLIWNDEVFVIGEREFKPDDVNLYTRTFVARYQLYGDEIGLPWTSPGDFLPQEAMTTVSVCGTALIAGGWTRGATPGSSPLPLVRWIKPDGTSTEGHSDLLPSTQIYGIACDREGKIVSGATKWDGEFDTRVFASESPKLPPLIYDNGVFGEDATLALACDADESFCVGGGFRSPSAFLRVYHP